MKKILDKLTELVSICEVRVKKVDDAAKKNAEESARLIKLKEDVDALNEIAVEGLERLNALKAKHENLEDAKRLKKELQGEIKRYQALQVELKGQFSDAEKVKKEGLDEIEAKKEKLQKEIDKLNEDKKSYKAEIMKSISKELKSKGIEL